LCFEESKGKEVEKEGETQSSNSDREKSVGRDLIGQPEKRGGVWRGEERGEREKSGDWARSASRSLICRRKPILSRGNIKGARERQQKGRSKNGEKEGSPEPTEGENLRSG